MAKTIKLKSLELVNFKGIRELKIDFSEDITNIRGRNGSGKTTLFDAFTYVLFGKDSKDRKEFNIKTLDSNNKPIPRIPHEVKCVLSVDGESVELCRRYCEKWTKKRGSAIEEFSGHEEERFYNGVPCSVKEYASKVSAICDETVFKFITNPLHFTGQKADVQRSMLFRMAGGVSDEEVAKGNSDFLSLLKNLTGKTLEEYKREIGAKKRRIKEAVESIPARIDERKRDFYEEEDWDALTQELKEKRQTLASLDKSLADVSEAFRAKGAKKEALWQELLSVRNSKMARMQEIESQLLKEYNQTITEVQSIKTRLDYIEREKASVRAQITALRESIDTLGKERSSLLEEWKAIKAETISFSEDQFICPTCGRKYEMDEIESKQIELSEKFQQRKTARLEENKSKGLRIREKIEGASGQIDSLEKRLAELETEELELRSNPILSRQMEKPETESVISADKAYTEICNKETDIKNQIDAVGDDAPDTAEIQEGKTVVMEAIREIEARLSRRALNERNAERIAELEEELQAQSQELAELEGIEYTIAQFSKARIERIEERVNSLFKLVRFKMFEQQLNGGEVETCEAMVDGVPFSDLNNAGRINAGLDIINAICNFEGVYAPIFIDNAESVNQLLPTISQTVRLIVTEDKSLVKE